MIAGQLLALVVLLVLQNLLLDDKALRDWGWRIPFAIGALLAVVALLMRRDLAGDGRLRERRRRSAARARCARFSRTSARRRRSWG